MKTIHISQRIKLFVYVTKTNHYYAQMLHINKELDICGVARVLEYSFCITAKTNISISNKNVLLSKQIYFLFLSYCLFFNRSYMILDIHSLHVSCLCIIIILQIFVLTTDIWFHRPQQFSKTFRLHCSKVTTSKQLRSHHIVHLRSVRPQVGVYVSFFKSIIFYFNFFFLKMYTSKSLSIKITLFSCHTCLNSVRAQIIIFKLFNFICSEESCLVRFIISLISGTTSRN